MSRLAALLLALALPLSAAAVSFDTVHVGNPGNAADLQAQGLFGRVTYDYRIATTPVTNSQYVEFLNAVAADDPYALYDIKMGYFEEGGSIHGGILRGGTPGSYTYTVKPDVMVDPDDGGASYTYTFGDKPVNYVSWFDAVRFANWMHNGQGNGSTEMGAYTVLGGTPVPSNADTITRSGGATWFLPTEHEWYKAAYYDGGTGVYYDYPTGSDVPPDNNPPENDTGNSANFIMGFDTATGSLDYPFTPVGAYTQSDSPYGTFDQGGNVWEWNQALVSAGVRARRGGAWDTEVATLAAAHRGSLFADAHVANVGFRLATVFIPDDLTGDYNNDGLVDAADYVLWRKNDGSTTGYVAWRTNFGMIVSGGAAAAGAAVPEPAILTLLACTFLSCYFIFRSRGR